MQNSPNSQISIFWHWWQAEGRFLDPSKDSPTISRLTTLLHNIHPDLTWHLGPGNSAEHSLTVSAAGNPEVLPWATRWHRAAPAADSTWEFYPAMQADPTFSEQELSIGGHELKLTETVFGISPDADRRRVDVIVFHPEFSQLPEDALTTIKFLILDWVLGEDDVERWIGTIDTSPVFPPDAGTASDLRSAVAALHASRSEHAYRLLSGTLPNGAPVIATVCTHMRWIDLPNLDLHHSINVPFQPDNNGFPDAPTLEALQALEDELVRHIEPQGLLIAHETFQGVRIFHVYTDGMDQNIGDSVHRFAASRGLQVQTEADPGWSSVTRFTG